MIRNFESNDIDEIMQIWKNENIRAHHFIPREYWENNYHHVIKILPDANIHVYTLEKKIVGFIGLSDNYIAGIFVDANNQGCGIGSALLNKAKESRNILTLTVYQKNINAIKFYQKNNFIIAGENIDQATNEAEYLMSWKNHL